MPGDFERCYALLQELTPLAADCGAVCGGACCRDTGEDNGMLLFPGEREFLAAAWPDAAFRQTAGGGWLLTCDGACDRRMRPLSCRIFPLFPMLGADGRIRAELDPRAFRVCPLVQWAQRVCLQRDFVRTVRRVGRLLAADEACRLFLQEQTHELEAWGRLLPDPAGRKPIQRRKVEVL